MASANAFEEIMAQYRRAEQEQADPKLVLSLKYAAWSYGRALMSNIRCVCGADELEEHIAPIMAAMAEHGLDVGGWCHDKMFEEITQKEG